MTEYDVWSQDEEHVEYDSDIPEGPFAMVNGSYISVNVGDSFKDTIQSLARDAGFGKFRVTLNGEEVRPNEAPDTILDNMQIGIRPYDVAG